MSPCAFPGQDLWSLWVPSGEEEGQRWKCRGTGRLLGEPAKGSSGSEGRECGGSRSFQHPKPAGGPGAPPCTLKPVFSSTCHHSLGTQSKSVVILDHWPPLRPLKWCPAWGPCFLPSPTSPCAPSRPLCSSHTGPSACPSFTTRSLTPGPLHMLFLCLGTLSPPLFYLINFLFNLQILVQGIHFLTSLK